jgi:hypothetical protein
VNKGITGFYRKLYEFREVDLEEGPEGIPNSTNKKLWSVVGSYILNSWKHQNATSITK